jgi:hypothetical protein
MCLAFSSLSSIHWMVERIWVFVCFSVQWIELKLENAKHISTGGNNLTWKLSRSVQIMFRKAHKDPYPLHHPMDWAGTLRDNFQVKLFPPVLMCLAFSSLSSNHWMVERIWVFVCFSEHYRDASWQFSGQIVSTCAIMFRKAHKDPYPLHHPMDWAQTRKC